MLIIGFGFQIGWSLLRHVNGRQSRPERASLPLLVPLKWVFLVDLC